MQLLHYIKLSLPLTKIENNLRACYRFSLYRNNLNKNLGYDASEGLGPYSIKFSILAFDLLAFILKAESKSIVSGITVLRYTQMLSNDVYNCLLLP